MRQKHKVQSPESNPGAVHVLTIPTIPPKPVVELTADEYEGAKKAMELIFRRALLRGVILPRLARADSTNTA